MTDQIQTLMSALERNNMQPFYAENKEEALAQLRQLLPKGGTVTHGGSVTLQACGVPALLKSGDYTYLDSNRVAAILYGPKEVIFIVGINKIVDNLEQAVERVRSIAAPKNTVRLNCPTYCKEKGHCVAEAGASMGEGCSSDGRICCNYVVSAKQRHKNRMKVIIVNEELGY